MNLGLVALIIMGIISALYYGFTGDAKEKEKERLIRMKQIETKSYYFMTYAEWFYIDENFDIKLTKIGSSVPEAKKSYEQYLKDKEEA